MSLGKAVSNRFNFGFIVKECGKYFFKFVTGVCLSVSPITGALGYSYYFYHYRFVLRELGENNLVQLFQFLNHTCSNYKVRKCQLMSRLLQMSVEGLSILGDNELQIFFSDHV